MRRVVRIEKSKGRREARWREALPPDPRDVDVVRAKAIRQIDERNVTSRHG
jgi:hypothetical protein